MAVFNQRKMKHALDPMWNDIETAFASYSAAIADNSITNAKLATDAKVGSLAALTTTEKASAIGAINELDAGKYEKPGTGIPSSDMATAVQTSLGKADTALQSITSGSITNDMHATDVKIGSLAALTTTEKGSVQGAINELVTAKYVKPAGGIPSTDMTAAVQTSLGLANTAMQNLVGVAGTPVNAVAAQGTLTISGVALDGETITVRSDVYEFAADTALSVAPGNIAIDLNSVTTKSQGTLTIDTQITSGNTMTIGVGAGSKVYTFVPNGTANADGEVSVGTDLATCQAALVAAVNGSDGHNTAHTQVTIGNFALDAAVITALIGGTAGDLIATTETFTAGTNIFDAVTLGTTTAGVDCTPANAEIRIAATAGGTGYTWAGGAGTTVVVTASTKGSNGNLIALATTMSNAVWDAAFLGTTTLGVDGTVGNQWDSKVDASYWYVCIAANTIADTNWRRVSLGTVY